MTTHALARPDAAARPGVRPTTLARAILVEARKLVDTRSGVALLIAAAALAAVFAGGRALLPIPTTTYGELVSMAAGPGGLILMILAILLATSEFSAGTASATFVLEPRRGRILLAKTVVVVGMAVVVTALAFVVAAGAMVIAPALGAPALPWSVDVPRVLAVTGAGAFTALAGLAWGFLTRSAPASIVLLLVWPTVVLLVGAVSDAARTVLGYLDLNAPYAFVTDPDHAGVRLVTSAAVWVVAPAALGVWRLLRGDLS